jgi:hypothetical protein
MTSAVTALTVERVFGDRVTKETFQIGVDGGVIGGGGFRSTLSVRWEENRLVIANSTYSGPRSADLMSEHKEIWELSPDDALIITVADTEADHDSKSTRLTYRRN